MHSLVEWDELNSIPERAECKPWGAFFVNDEVGVNCIPNGEKALMVNGGTILQPDVGILPT